MIIPLSRLEETPLRALAIGQYVMSSSWVVSEFGENRSGRSSQFCPRAVTWKPLIPSYFSER